MQSHILETVSVVRRRKEGREHMIDSTFWNLFLSKLVIDVKMPNMQTIQFHELKPIFGS
jgi:hypothetical protein